MDSAIKKLFSLLRTDVKKSAGADYTATVTRVEGNTAYVQMDGADINDTPVAMTINAGIGNRVRVRVSNGRAWITGNDDSPPTDNSYAQKVNEVLTGNITQTNENLGIVGKALEAVRKIAGNTDQYFWHVETGTDTGAHITEKPKDEFLADPENAGGNLLARSNGIAVREGLNELAEFSKDGLQIRSYDTTGSAVEICNLGYGEGNSQSGRSIDPYYTLGTRKPNTSIGNYSLAAGYLNSATASESLAEGYECEATGIASHAEGYRCKATASGAHAGGEESEAGGFSSHAFGVGAKATGSGALAVGQYNEDNVGYLLMLGNGRSDSNRANALAVDLLGNIWTNGSMQQSSDRRLKEHKSYIAASDAVEFIRSLKPAHYKKDGMDHVGFYAQDVQEVDPWNCATGEMNGYLTLNYTEIIAPLVRYCQELEKRIDKLEGK